MVDLKELTDEDIGQWVEYWPGKEKGRIKSWNNSFVFVVYHCGDDWENFQNYTAAATHPKALNKIAAPESEKLLFEV